MKLSRNHYFINSLVWLTFRLANWSEWNSGECVTKTEIDCGVGSRTSTRTCLNSSVGNTCQGASQKSEDCRMTRDCKPITISDICCKEVVIGPIPGHSGHGGSYTIVDGDSHNGKAYYKQNGGHHYISYSTHTIWQVTANQLAAPNLQALVFADKRGEQDGKVLGFISFILQYLYNFKYDIL